MQQHFYGVYKGVRNASWKILLQYGLRELPIQTTKIAQELGIYVASYGEGRVFIDAFDLQQRCRGNEGLTAHIGKWVILYDSSIMPHARIRFTIAHELAHILLGHAMLENRTAFYRLSYTAQNAEGAKQPIEREADMFAARLLAPACVLWGLGVHRPEDIMRLCGLSRTAATIRARRMELLYRRNKFLAHPLERQVYEQFKPFIDAHKRDFF